MKNINWEMIGAFIVIGISVVVGSWAGYKLFKFCSKLITSEFDATDQMFDNMFNEFEQAFKEEETRREKRNEEFKSRFNYQYYNHEEAKQNAKKAAQGMSLTEACRILGINEKDVKGMKMEDLKKIFRQKAMETHPDKGGSNESFRQTKDAFDFVSAAA